MAGEIQASYAAGKNLYALVRNSVSQIWNGSSFETYSTSNYSNYPVVLTQQGTSESFYAGNFPPSITPGIYSITVKNRVGVSPAETDTTVSMGDLNWNGSAVPALSDIMTSGQMSRYFPIVAFQGQMIQPFTFKLVSSVDSKTPFTSGVVSGQISRDGGSFGPLQSGAYTEIGLGWYALQALTSGDMNARIVSLNFKANGISGGSSDPRDFMMVMQKVSG